jgi:hypothetical protein
MKREDAEKLLGGYAAGILTPAEREALFTAALEDQQLFESLIGEEPLRELLEDPEARGRLLANLLLANPGQGHLPWYYHPLSPAAIAGIAAAVIAFAVLVYWRPVRRPQKTQVEPQVVTVRPEPKPFRTPSDITGPQPVKSPLPTQLSAPQELPPPPAVATTTKPPASVLEALTSAAVSAQALESPVIIAKGPARVVPMQAFRTALTPVADLLSLQHTILKKLPDGRLMQVDAQQELERDDEIVLRVQANEAGSVSILQQDSEKRWHPLTMERIQASVPLTIPRTGGLRADSPGTKEYQILFSPSRPAAQPLSIPITLKYK